MTRIKWHVCIEGNMNVITWVLLWSLQGSLARWRLVGAEMRIHSDRSHLHRCAPSLPNHPPHNLKMHPSRSTLPSCRNKSECSLVYNIQRDINLPSNTSILISTYLLASLIDMIFAFDSMFWKSWCSELDNLLCTFEYRYRLYNSLWLYRTYENESFTASKLCIVLLSWMIS